MAELVAEAAEGIAKKARATGWTADLAGAVVQLSQELRQLTPPTPKPETTSTPKPRVTRGKKRA